MVDRSVIVTYHVTYQVTSRSEFLRSCHLLVSYLPQCPSNLCIHSAIHKSKVSHIRWCHTTLYHLGSANIRSVALASKKWNWFSRCCSRETDSLFICSNVCVPLCLTAACKFSALDSVFGFLNTFTRTLRRKLLSFESNAAFSYVNTISDILTDKVIATFYSF